MTRDLAHAKVYITVLGTDGKETIEGLNSAVGYIRRELGKLVEIRSMPELHFFLDDSIEYSAHMQKIFSELNKDEHEK